MTTTVPCPGCGAQVAWCAESPWRPFCSERCKLLDLSGWLLEEYRIPEPPDPEAPDPPDPDEDPAPSYD